MGGSPCSGSYTRRSFLATGAGGFAALAGCITHGVDSGLEGLIRMDGSNTVLPHGALLAYEFQFRNNRVQIPAGSSGTGGGFQRFCRGEIDVQNASRPITDEEREHCADNGIDYIELEALLDGIAIFTNAANDWAECLTTEQARELWRSGSPIERWSDIDSEWPDERIRFHGRDSASGTFDSFTERLMGERGNIRRNYSETGDTNQIVRGVAGNPYAVGFGGAGYYWENQDRLNIIAIDNGDGCIIPEREAVETRTYAPLSRPMYVYLNVDELHRPEMQAFARFYFEEIDDEARDQAIERGVADPGESLMWTQWAAREVGFFGSPDDVLEETRQTLEEKIAEVA